MAVSYMTEEGYNKILAEINYLETVKRPEISAQIAEARDKGDLSENAEYDAAKEAQGIMEAKLAQLKGLIANARLIDESRVQTDEVQILNKVKIKNTKNNAVMTYMLVSDSEANLKEGKIAISTPIAQGLLGKKVGDIVEIKVPSGIMNFEIKDISISYFRVWQQYSVELWQVKFLAIKLRKTTNSSPFWISIRSQWDIHWLFPRKKWIISSTSMIRC